MVRIASNLSQLSRLAAAQIIQLVQRLGWGIADQGLSSITNFAIAITIIRLLGMPAFGAFTLAFTAYLIALNISRGLATDPLVIRYSGVERYAWRRATADSVGTALGVGTLAGMACVILGVLLGPALGPSLRPALLAIAVSLPGLLVQDAWRYAFFAAGRGGQAFINDLVWTIAQLAAFALVIRAGVDSLGPLVLAWGAAASVAAVVGVLQARTMPRPLRGWLWIRHHRDLGSRYMVENLSISGEYQLRTYGTGAIAGLEAVGSLRTADLLLGPLNVFRYGIEVAALPIAVRVMRRSVKRLIAICLLLGTGLASITTLWAGALFLLPDRIGTAILGSSWFDTKTLLVPLALWSITVALASGPRVGLRALAAAKRSLRTRLLSSALWLSGGLIGAAAAGAVGVAWGVASMSVISTALWWHQFGRGLHEQLLSDAPDEDDL